MKRVKNISIKNTLLLIIWILHAWGGFAQKNVSDEKANLLQLRKELLVMHNEIRGKNGAGPLVMNEKLHAAAQRHAEDMSRKNYFSHTGKDGSTHVSRASKAGYNYASAIGENIAQGQTTVKEVIDSWVNSPGHFGNIIEKEYKDVGFGYCEGYWVTVFSAGEKQAKAPVKTKRK